MTLQVFKHNWQIKLVAFVLALVCSYFVGREQNRATDELRLPVSIAAPVGQRVVSPPLNYFIYVSLEGPAEVLRTIRREDVQLRYDTSLVRPGRVYDIPVDVQLPEKYRERVIVTWSPRSMPVQFASEATRKMEVTVQPTNRLPGWQFSEAPQANPSTVTISGTEEAIAQVDRVVAPIALEESPRIHGLATLKAWDREGKPVRALVQIEPAQANVTGSQQRIFIEKRVPVQPVFTPPPGPPVTAEVIPSRIRIIGPERDLADVYVVETEPITVPRGGLPRRGVPLRSPRPGVQMEPSQVEVTIRVAPKAAAGGGRPRP